LILLSIDFAIHHFQNNFQKQTFQPTTMPRKPRVCGITHCNNTHWGNIDTLCKDCFKVLKKRVENKDGREAEILERKRFG